jgi:hydroxyacylglutathione hydrolase
MKFKKLENYYNTENTYIVYDENTLNGFVIDPGYKTEGILKAASDDGIKIKYVFITHCHYDHIQYMEELREKTGALLVCGDKAKINIKDPDINISLPGLGYEIIAKDAEIILKDGEEFIIDSMKIKCIYTPGHTNCSVCYLIDNDMFCGDTLFLRNCGRWDLPTGDENTLISSIKNKIYTLDENINLHPGHGESTTIGYEKKFNFFVKG